MSCSQKGPFFTLLPPHSVSVCTHCFLHNTLYYLSVYFIIDFFLYIVSPVRTGTAIFLASAIGPVLESVLNKHMLNEFPPKSHVYEEVLLRSPTESPLPSLFPSQQPLQAKD